METKIYDYIIIGAGISGLLTAKELQHHFEVIVLEKSRGLLGRITEFRDRQNSFLKGVSQFKAQHNEVINLLNKIEMNPDSENVFHFDRDSRTKLKNEFSDVNILKQARVIHIEEDDQKLFQVKYNHAGEEKELTSRAIILSGPVPQMIELLEQFNIKEIEESLKAISYEKISIVCDLKNREKLDRINDLKLVNLAKGVYQVDFDFNSKEELDNAISASPDTFHTHFWKYGNCQNPLSKSFLSNNNLYFIGDGFANGGMEGAILSSMALINNLTISKER